MFFKRYRKPFSDFLHYIRLGSVDAIHEPRKIQRSLMEVDRFVLVRR
jgi:hypothetical protein